MSAVPTSNRPPRTRLESLLSILSDTRTLQIVGQLIFLVLVYVAVTGIVNAIFFQLDSRSLTPSFSVFENRAGFELANAPGYSADDSFWDAYLVGLLNTIVVVIAGLIGATLLGILAGILLLSRNWLFRNITGAVVEILRNTPLLIQIVVVYFVVLGLPAQREALTFPNEAILPIPTRLAFYAIAAFLVWRTLRALPPNQHVRRRLITSALLVAIVAIELGFRLLPIRAGDALVLTISGIELITFPPRIAPLIPWAILTLVLLVIVNSLKLAIPLKNTLLGALIGLLIGSALFFFDIIPATYARVETSPAFYLSNRGFVYPELVPTGRFAEWIIFVIIGVIVAAFLYVYFARVQEQTGQLQPRLLSGLGITILLAVIGWIVVTAQPQPTAVPVRGDDGTTALVPLEEARADGLLTRDDNLLYARTPLSLTLPQPQGLRFISGFSVSQNFVAVFVALVIYTAAFIAEIVRAGILAVPKGQIEAARALGLSQGQMLRRVILPQALRVIIPPLGNQYLNLSKNSSLAIAVAFSDVYAVMYTVINQTGQSVTGIVLLMITYLVISLIIAAIMNLINGRFQLVTR